MLLRVPFQKNHRAALIVAALFYNLVSVAQTDLNYVSTVCRCDTPQTILTTGIRLCTSHDACESFIVDSTLNATWYFFEPSGSLSYSVTYFDGAKDGTEILIHDGVKTVTNYSLGKRNGLAYTCYPGTDVVQFLRRYKKGKLRSVVQFPR